MATCATYTPLSRSALCRFRVQLRNACERSISLGHELVEDAHAAGVLSADFTSEDLMAVLWMAGTASHAPEAPTGWRRVVDRSIAAAWID